MPLPGGPADKIGNRYERRWGVASLVDILDGSADSIRFEVPGKAGAGFEFRVLSSQGSAWHQVKRQHSRGRWSLADLKRAGVLDSFGRRLAAGDHCVFASTVAAEDLRELTERARASQTFDEFATDFLRACVWRQRFEALRDVWGGGDENVYTALGRVEIHTIDERQLERWVWERVGHAVEGDPPSAADVLAQLVDNSVHRELDAAAIWEHLERRGFRRLRAQSAREVEYDVDFRVAKALLRDRRFEDAEALLLRLVARADAEGSTGWAVRARLALLRRRLDARRLPEAEALLGECERLIDAGEISEELRVGVLRARCRARILTDSAEAVEGILTELASRELPADDIGLAHEILRAGVDLAMLHAGLGHQDDADSWADRIARRLSVLQPDENLRRGVAEAVDEVRLRLAVEGGDIASIEQIARTWGDEQDPEHAEQNAYALLHYANLSRHLAHYECGIPCARGAATAARTAELEELALGAEQTEAALLCMAGRQDEGLRLNDQVRISAETRGHATVVVAARLLAADHALQKLDAAEARTNAEAALRAAPVGEPVEVLARQGLADACWLEGDADLAHEHLRRALHVGERVGMPASERARLLKLAVDVVGQNGLWDDAERYLTDWEGLAVELERDGGESEIGRRRIAAYRELRERFESIEAPGGTRVQLESLSAGVARIVRPVLEWWDDFGRASPDLLDYWGRGNFIRVLRLIAAHRRAVVVVVEARTRRDIELTLRLCGLLADSIIVLWKGPCAGGQMLTVAPFHHEGPGGAGYVLAAGARVGSPSGRGTWVPAIATGRCLPQDVIDLLAEEARPWFESGRLVVVPAWSVGCVSRGFGPFEQLLAKTVHGTPIIRSPRDAGSPFRMLPWFPEVPLSDLEAVAEDPDFSRPRLRHLLMERSRELSASPGALAESELEQEIEAELQELGDQVERRRRQHGWAVSREAWASDRIPSPATGGSDARPAPTSPWLPFLRIGKLGYHWQVNRVSAVLQAEESSPADDEPFEGAGEWLAPDDSRPRIPIVRAG